MREVGRVAAIWRYPVKSMRGESLESCDVGDFGIPGDRGWAVRDEAAGEMRGAKKFPVLMQCRAQYRSEPSDVDIPPVEIELPDGTRTASDADDVGVKLSACIGRKVTLWPRRPSEDREHYRRKAKFDEPTLREIFGRLPDEPLPDLTALPRELLRELTEYTSPLGTYFDAYPIQFVSTSWLATLAEHNPKARFEAPRFRPNFLIETEEPGLVELGWCGKALRIGGVRLTGTIPTMRCSMTVQATEDLEKDLSVLRTIVRESDQNVGVYATVDGAGGIRVGDSVELL